MTIPVSPHSPTAPPADPTAGLKLAFAWLFVGIPAAWGIWNVIVNTMALFR
ncbi:MAG: oxalate:formate antiporter [Acidobacteriota bacterium]|nr:oxalate:formate antiporter [Acidobacteriota bacterium]